MPRYIDIDTYKENIESAIDDLIVQLEFTPTTEVVPWAFLERCADQFCGADSPAEFVRMVKLLWEREHGDEKRQKMSDPIDRDKLTDFIMESDPEWCVNPIRPIFDYIKSMPTADEAKLVRCKDCKYHEDEVPGMVWCPHIVGNWVNNNWFCADGKQKQKENSAG